MHWQHVIMERFTFPNVHGRKGECRIEATKLPDGRIVVIATELADNPGMSITNAAEYVATDVCEALGIAPHQLIWIEFYGYPASPSFGRKRTYDLVTFATMTPEGRPIFHEPRWRPMNEGDWKTLGIPARFVMF